MAFNSPKDMDNDFSSGGGAEFIAQAEKSIRHGFIRKVYGILCCQLAVTFGIVAIFIYSDCQATTNAYRLRETGMTCDIGGTSLTGEKCTEKYMCVTTKTTGTKAAGNFWESISDCREDSACSGCCCMMPGKGDDDSTGGLGCFARTSSWFYIFAMIFAFGTLIGLACCGNAAKKFPTNYILLSVFTVAEGVMVGTICLYYSAEVVWLALLMTCLVTLGLTLFACQTKYDFTGMGGYLFAGLMALTVFGFVLMVFGSVNGAAMSTTYKVYAGIGVFIFSLYIVYDTQLIMGGKHKKYSFGVDDYVFASLNLYLDIINLFIYLLAIMGSDR